MSATNTQLIAAALLAATEPMTVTELATAAAVDRQKAATICWNMGVAGAIIGVKAPGEQLRYTVVDQDDLKQRSEGPAARGPKKKAKVRHTKNLHTLIKTAREEVPDPTVQFFYSEPDEVQLVPTDPDRAPFIMPMADALRLVKFIERLRGAREPA